MRVSSSVLLVHAANADLKWKALPQPSRKEFRYGAVESLYRSSDISRDRHLDKKYFYEFSEAQGPIQSFAFSFIDKFVPHSS